MANVPFTYAPGWGNYGPAASPVSLANSDAFGMPFAAPSAPFAGNPAPGIGDYGAIGVPTLGAQALGDLPLDIGGAVPGGFMDSFSNWLSGGGLFGKTNPDGTRSMGAAGTILGGLQALGSAYMGMKQYGLAKQQLAEGRRQYDQNYAAQRTTVNSQLEDRQRARLASNPGAYQSVGDYMTKYGVR